MSDVAIRVENISKLYRIGLREKKHDSFVGAIVDFVKRPVRNLKRLQKLSTFREVDADSDDVIWALRNVSFEVKRGEVVGIIGRNGSGKSTLLKIISRITEPSEGRGETIGRIGSLLEVGTGFHPELTGRENIYLNGVILGMRKAEVDKKFDEIVAFSEIDKFIDTPVKRYSSGMKVRLAFAVAAHLEPEILLVDEVLAVGDAAFQKKCLGKMQDVASEGRTALFVSHNMVAVQSLCGRVIWLDDGRVVEEGGPDPVVSKYLQASFKTLTERLWDDVTIAPGNDRVRMHLARIRPEKGSPSDRISIRTPLVMEFEYWNLEPDAHLNLSVCLYNETGVMVFNTASIHEPIWQGRPFPAGLFRSQCRIPGDLLNDGMHRVQLLVVKDQGVVVFRDHSVLAFDVADDAQMRGEWHGKWRGAVRPNLKWETEYLKRRSEDIKGE